MEALCVLFSVCFVCGDCLFTRIKTHWFLSCAYMVLSLTSNTSYPNIFSHLLGERRQSRAWVPRGGDGDYGLATSLRPGSHKQTTEHITFHTNCSEAWVTNTNETQSPNNKKTHMCHIVIPGCSMVEPVQIVYGVSKLTRSACWEKWLIVRGWLLEARGHLHGDL